MLLLFVFLFDILITLLLRSVFTPLPISDTGSVRYRTIPWMTMTLILINSVVFIILQAPNLYQGAQLIEQTPPLGVTQLTPPGKDVFLAALAQTLPQLLGHRENSVVPFGLPPLAPPGERGRG